MIPIWSHKLAYSRSLRELLIFGLAITNIVVFVFLGYSLYQSRQQYELRAETQTQNISSGLEQSISKNFEKIGLATHTVVYELEKQLAEHQVLNDQDTNALLINQQQWIPEIDTFVVANYDGFIINGKEVRKKDLINISDREYFTWRAQKPTANGKLISVYATNAPEVFVDVEDGIVSVKRAFKKDGADHEETIYDGGPRNGEVDICTRPENAPKTERFVCSTVKLK